MAGRPCSLSASRKATRERGGGQRGRQSNGPTSFGPFCPCDAAESQAWAGPYSQEEGLGARHPPTWPSRRTGVGFSPGQGTPTQEVSWASGPARQTDNRRDHGGSCCSRRFPTPHQHCRQAREWGSACADAVWPQPPCRSWPGVLRVARLRHGVTDPLSWKDVPAPPTCPPCC